MDNERGGLPPKGLDRETILEKMKSIGGSDADFRTGKTWSLVYYLGEEYTDFLKDAYGAFFSQNGLNPMAFKSLKQFESEVIRMTARMLHGGELACGTMTSGGTESCLLAVKTCRDMARAKKPWIRKPEMIVPESVHVAFQKAAKYFDIKLISAPLAGDYRVDVRAVAKSINRNTIMLVGSAPCYPFGVIDPIEDLGQLAQKHRVPLHVDACLGGYLLPFAEKLGNPVAPFDFRVPGVTSISADTHKYGYSAKGASTITYRSMEYLRHQFFIHETWSGGLYVSPALLGTRPGGAIAAAWAAMMHMGEDGYRKLAGLTLETTRELIDKINAIPELKVIGKPDMSVFAYTSTRKDIGIYAVGDRMEQKGWHIDKIQKPEGLHLMVTANHKQVVDEFIADLKEAVAEVRKRPELAQQGGAAMYGLVANIPLRGMVRKNVLKMMEGMYGPEGEMPAAFGNEEEDVQKHDFSMKAGLLYLKLKNFFKK
jgi:sphinganine-1-phosphate aldolase